MGNYCSYYVTIANNVIVPVRTHGFLHLTTTIRFLTPVKNKQIILLPYPFIINLLFTFVVRSSSLFSSSALLHYSGASLLLSHYNNHLEEKPIPE